MGERLRKLIRTIRYSIEGMCVILSRMDLSTAEVMDRIDQLRRKYGLKEWSQ